MSDKSIQKHSIMDYLPPQEKAKLRELVQRLVLYTEEKEKFKKLYEQSMTKYEELKRKYEDLEEENNYLKSQIATSRLAITKAQQIASKSAKKLTMFQMDQQNSSQLKQQTQNLKQTWLKIPKPQPSTQPHKPPYIFQQPQHCLQMNPPLPPKTQESGMKQTSRKAQSSSLHNSSNKKQEIMNLRKQIQSLTQQMKKKENMGLTLNQKIKKSEEIKNRYLKSKQNNSKVQGRDKFREEEEEEEDNEEEDDDCHDQFVADRNRRKQKDISKVQPQRKIERSYEKDRSNKSWKKNKKSRQQESEEDHLSNMESDSGENSSVEEEQKYRKTKKTKNNREEEFEYERNKKTENKKQKTSRNEQIRQTFESERQPPPYTKQKKSQKQFQKEARAIPQQKKEEVEVIKKPKEKRKQQLSQQFDQSLSALIDQLNFKG